MSASLIGSVRSCAKRAAVVAVGLCAVFAFGEVRAADPFAGYSHTAKITVTGYAGETTLTNFPLLVKLSEGVGGFSYDACRQAKGGDVRFTRGDGVELPSACVSWNTSGTSEFWVRVPELEQDTAIYMVYGNADAPARDQKLQVWDDDYSAVWNMDDTGYALIDASGNSNHGTAKTTSTHGAGVVGNARVFSSDNSDYARAGHGYDDSFSAPNFTYEGWFKMPAYPSSKMSIFGYSVQDGNYNTAALLRDVQLTTAGKPVLVLKDASYEATCDAPTLDAWHHVAVTYDGGTDAVVVYLDGAAVKSGKYTGKHDSANPMNRFQFGQANYIGPKDKYFNGSLDEIRVSRAVRSADYCAAVYGNLANNGSFLSLEDWTEAIPAVDPQPKRKFTIKLSAEAGGTVSPSGTVEVEEGAYLDVTATATAATKAFYAWGGNCPTTQVFSAKIRIPADCDRTLTARFGTLYTIEPEAGVDVIKNGLDKIAEDAEQDPSVLPAVLALKQGTYALVNPYVKKGYGFTISSPIAVRSADGVGKAVLDFGSVQGRAAFNLKSMGAVIDGLTFINGAEKSAYNGNVIVAWVEKGHLLNCTVDAYRVRSDDDSCIQVDAGWVSRCRFLNATSVQAGTRSYPIVMGGGTLFDSCVVSNFCGSRTTVLLGGAARNCLFASCSAKHASLSYGGAVRFANSDGKDSNSVGASAYAENCTFVNCSAVYGGAVAYTFGSLSPVVVNCAFLGNTAANAAQGHDFYQTVLANCVSKNAEATDDNLVADPVFTDGVSTPAANSPTRDAGRYARWAFVSGMTDVAGSNRVEEAAVDIGCREFPKPAHEPLSVNVTAGSYEGRDALTTTFTASVTGDKTGLTYEWDFGDGSAHESSASPTHMYSKPGYYALTLVVANDLHETNTFSRASFITVLPSVCYVRAAGESVPTDPYATPETAADRLCDVLAIAPERIDVGAGDIELGDFCNITQPMVIRGKGPELTRFDLGFGMQEFGADVRPIFLKHGQAVLADVTVTIKESCNWSTPVGMTAGLMTNCVVRGNRSQNATGVSISGGMLIDCAFIGNSNTYSGVGAVSVEGSGVKILNCRFEDNLSTIDKGGSCGAALRIVGDYNPAPIVRNCLFARNVHQGEDSFGVIYARGSLTMENCTVVSNSYQVGKRGGGLAVCSAGVVCRNTIFWGNVCGDQVEDIRAAAGKEPVLTACSVGVDPCFKHSDRGDYRIWLSSPCVNAGVKLDWMTEDATDLRGNLRIKGLIPDMGCYENPNNGLMLLVK